MEVWWDSGTYGDIRTWNGVFEGRINEVAYIDLLGIYMTPSIYCQSSDSILGSQNKIIVGQNSLCSYFSDSYLLGLANEIN